MALPGRKSLTVGSVKSPSSQQGNLTGPKRVVNDNIVTIYNSIQKWNQFFHNGIQLMQDVQNTEGSDAYQICCEKLGIVVESMDLQTGVMSSCVKKLQSLSELQSGEAPIFLTWKLQDFGKYFQ